MTSPDLSDLQDSKAHWANMGPTWGRQDPHGPHVGPMNLAIRLNTLTPRQNGCHFPDDIFKCIFLNENLWISIKISVQFVLKDLINDIPALVQIMAWRWPGDKPLSKAMMVNLQMHVCITGPQWVSNLSISVVTYLLIETEWCIYASVK